jgi:uncharacterized protein (DUF2267 family)
MPIADRQSMRLFDKATQQATVWVKDMMVALGTDDPHEAWHALRAGLHALRDRLTVDEAAQLSAQLPQMVRGAFYESWVPAGKPLRIRHREEFLALVREKYGTRSEAPPPEDIVVAVFRVLGKHVSSGELTDIILTLPEPIAAVVTGRAALEQPPSQH